MSFCVAQPVHHQINNYLNTNGYTDSWTKWHGATGAIKGLIAGSDIVWDWRYYQFGHEQPSGFGKLWRNFKSAVAWEILEFGVEGKFSWNKYREMYKHPWRNNITDVVVDCLFFGACITDELWWDLHLFFHADDTTINITVWKIL